MQNRADDIDGVATCIMCGKPLAGLEKVKYRDWWAHAECAQEALEKQVDEFNRTPFFLGSLGIIFGFILNFIIVLQYQAMSHDPLYYAISYLGMALGLAFQAYGFYGFAINYDEGLGIICAIFALVTSVFHFLIAGLTLVYGYDSSYYNTETGDFIFQLIPGVPVVLFAAFGLLLIMMVIVGVMVSMLGESISAGFDNRIISVVFMAAATCMIWSPVNFFVESFLVTVLFLTAKVPEEWKKIELD